MKAALHRVLFVGMLLVTITMPQAQEAAPDDGPRGDFVNLPKLVRVQVEFIDLAHEQLTGLMFGEHTTTNDTELRKKVGELVAKDEATVVETMICVAKSGQKATTESIKEVIYATEYEPAILPSSVQTTVSGDKTASPNEDLATGPTPSAWDTRNAGSTLEVEPTLGENGRLIDLRFVPEIVYHVGEQTWAEWRDKRGTADIKMPIFYTLRLNAAVTVVPGQYLLAGALSPKGKDGNTDSTRKVMVFVRCEVLTTIE